MQNFPVILSVMSNQNAHIFLVLLHIRSVFLKKYAEFTSIFLKNIHIGYIIPQKIRLKSALFSTFSPVAFLQEYLHSQGKGRLVVHPANLFQ